MGNLGYPYTPTHPGEVIKEEIEYRGISQKVLSQQMGVSYSLLNEILNGKALLRRLLLSVLRLH